MDSKQFIFLMEVLVHIDQMLSGHKQVTMGSIHLSYWKRFHKQLEALKEAEEADLVEGKEE